MIVADPGTMAGAAAGLGAVVVASGVGLRAWQGWLDLRRLELSSARGGQAEGPSPATRIEVADLKERVRRLEAIANGIDG